MEREMKSLNHHRTWKLVSRTQHNDILGCKWSFKVTEEHRQNRILSTRFKARLVAKEYSQVECVDYLEIFIPVTNFTFIRIILATVAFFNLNLHQTYAVPVFRYRKLQEDVFTEHPKGFICGGKWILVCHLANDMYDLKQAHRECNKVIYNYFSEHLGMIQGSADACVYIDREIGQVVLVALYM